MSINWAPVTVTWVWLEGFLCFSFVIMSRNRPPTQFLLPPGQRLIWLMLCCLLLCCRFLLSCLVIHCHCRRLIFSSLFKKVIPLVCSELSRCAFCGKRVRTPRSRNWHFRSLEGNNFPAIWNFCDELDNESYNNVLTHNSFFVFFQCRLLILNSLLKKNDSLPLLKFSVQSWVTVPFVE